MNMASKIIFLLFLVKIYLTKSDDVVKSSLTFVIDDTGSMFDDIEQVKASANLIFDAVMESKHSQIENFVLVTFNDPDVRPATVTRDRDTFKQALNNIVVYGGIDCPEFSMSGIESALKHSLPGSYLYVFTDASSKDYTKYEQVKSLAQKKSSQIVFVLTGTCDSNEADPRYVVYHDISRATSGQVFHLGKSDVKKILEYVIESIKDRRTILGIEEFEPGYGKLMNYTTDEHIPSVLISVSGDEPKIDVTDHEGGKPDTETLVNEAKVAIVKVTGTQPGTFTAEVGSKSKTSVVISGKTTIDFQHGFSTFVPTSITDTATRPQRDTSSYLSIKLNIIKGEEVKLTHVKILDLDGNSLLEEPLDELDEKNRLYATHDPIETPTAMFRIMMIGYSVVDNATITRLSPTPIEPQNPATEPKENRPPKVTVVEAPKITVNYEEHLKLKCKVNAYPKPDVIWQEESSKTVLPSTVAAVELPYDYISILEIEKVNRNSTYVCKASNSHGVATQAVAVEVPVYFNVLEKPKDAVVKYNTSGIFLCKIDATPPANITWYRNGTEIGEHEDLSVSPDGSVLTIPNMEPILQGHYECKANNGYENVTFKFKVAISGVKTPKLDKHINTVHAPKGSDPVLICRLTEGIPTPKFTWYFKSSLGTKFVQLRGSRGSSIKFNNVNTLKDGTYKCVAYNDIGYDEHNLVLVVEYPPTIKESEKKLSSKAGETVTLKCDVDGNPPPLVQWTKDDILIKNSPTAHIYRDHSLKLLLSVEDSGTYRCIAGNRLGKASKTVEVDVYIPAYIEPPAESQIYSKVGEDISLVCNADGFPKPDVQWTIRNSLGDTSTIAVSPGDSKDLNIPRAQLNDEGNYTCIAKNSGGSFNITYDVRVYSPPDIINVYVDKTFKPVEGDLVLTIKCNATGSPKPVITWTKDGLNIASGTPWYDIDEHGTLYIKNIDAESSGTYVCRAVNVLGGDAELYYVAVDPYPTDVSPTSSLQIQQGSSSIVECNVPHNLLDTVRWYKDGKLIARNKLLIADAKISDSGVYVCRVSDFTKSRSGSTTVEVGFKPRFITDEDEDVEFVEGYIAELICSAEAQPPAKTTWWHNGNMLNITSPENVFYMKMSDYGNYTCKVTNEFGQIQRTFKMRARDCILSVTDDFKDNQPLMFTSPLNWPSYEVVDGRVVIPNGDYISLLCPESFTKFPTGYAMAFCEGETNFTIKGDSYKYADLKCTRRFEPHIMDSGDECLGEGSELFQVEFEVLDGFLPAYQICFDRKNNIPFYTKHQLDRHVAGVVPKNMNWLKSDLLPLGFDHMYNCNNQIPRISTDLGKWFHASDRCCFSKRQLINSQDMVPGVLQASTFNYFNVAPHWSTCNTNNWDDLEQKLRNLAKSIDYPLTIWTGTADHLKLSARSSKMKPIYIYDGEGKKQPVPLYLWKVVQDPVTRSSLAIVQINIPDLDPSKAFEYVRCGDICADIPWMQGSSWHDVTKGYTYCCNIQDFENAFGYHRVFKRGHNRLLKDVSFMAEHSLTT